MPNGFSLLHNVFLWSNIGIFYLSSSKFLAAPRIMLKLWFDKKCLRFLIIDCIFAFMSFIWFFFAISINMDFVAPGVRLLRFIFKSFLVFCIKTVVTNRKLLNTLLLFFSNFSIFFLPNLTCLKFLLAKSKRFYKHGLLCYSISISHAFFMFLSE